MAFPMVAKSGTYAISHKVVKNGLFSDKYVKPCEALVFLGFPSFLVAIPTKNLTSLLCFFRFTLNFALVGMVCALILLPW